MNPETAADAVKQAANRLGVVLPPGGAAALAAAALTFADNILGINRVAWRDEWESAAYRRHLRKRMQHQLLEALITAEVLPVTLPAEKLTYHVARYAGISPPLPEDAPWDQVEVTLRVQTRRARGVT